MGTGGPQSDRACILKAQANAPKRGGTNRLRSLATGRQPSRPLPATGMQKVPRPLRIQRYAGVKERLAEAQTKDGCHLFPQLARTRSILNSRPSRRPRSSDSGVASAATPGIPASDGRTTSGVNAPAPPECRREAAQRTWMPSIRLWLLCTSRFSITKPPFESQGNLRHVVPGPERALSPRPVRVPSPEKIRYARPRAAPRS